MGKNNGSFSKSDLQQLAGSLRGRVLLANEAGYDEVRAVWNGMFDRKPALIVQCLGASDVVKAVKFARQHDLLLSVKGGGHHIAGKSVCDDGLMIDLSLMRSVHVDPDKKTVRVDGGCLLSDVDKETQMYGLAVPAGIVSHTGVGGLTLGGGFGWISRKYGFTIDNLLSAEVVTADGQVVTASEKTNSDLFWGLRGGGGNFGVVTSFEFNCAYIGKEVFSGIIAHRFEDARSYMHFHAEYVRTLPDEMTVWMVIRHAPPLPFLDKDVHGKLVVLVPFVYLGDEAEGKKLIEPVQNFGQPHGVFMGMNSWTDWQAGFDGLNTHGARNYWKSHHLKELSTACIEKVLEYAQKLPTESTEIFIPHMEGAPGRVPADATAYSFRSNPFVLNVHTRWESEQNDRECISWAREFSEQTKVFAEGVYVNFLSDEGDDRVREAYTSGVWERLVHLKNKYDPQNVFRMNQNIQPTVN